MLSYFKIINFKSILDVKVYFTYSEGKAPNNYEDLQTYPFLEIDKQNRFVPCMSFYGANASGKTNITKALIVLNKILREGIIGKYEPNKLNQKYDYSLFELEFFKDSIKYTYSIEYDKSAIRKEKLLKNDNVLYSIDKFSKNNFANIKTESYDEIKLNTIIDVECSQFNLNGTQKTQIFTFLSKINNAYKGLNKDLVDVFNCIVSSIIINLRNDLPYTLALDKLSNFENDNITLQQSFDELSEMLRKFDIDIKRMSINRELFPQNGIVREITIKNPTSITQDNKNKLIKVDYINSYHQDVNNQEIAFNFGSEESNGTQILLSLLGFILYALRNGSVLVIDEIDRALHPMLLIQIIKLFKDKTYNKNKAQLIFTCHATDLLDANIFRISEVTIINKNLKEGTTIKRISDLPNVRNVTDFRKLYWNGMLGGIPFPYI